MHERGVRIEIRSENHPYSIVLNQKRSSKKRSRAFSKWSCRTLRSPEVFSEMASTLDEEQRQDISAPNILEQYCPAPACFLDALCSVSILEGAVGPGDSCFKVSPFIGIVDKAFEASAPPAPLARQISLVSWNANLVDVSAMSLAIETLEATEPWDFICIQVGYANSAPSGSHETRPLGEHTVFVGTDLGGRRAPMIVVNHRWCDQVSFCAANRFAIGVEFQGYTLWSAHLSHLKAGDDICLEALEECSATIKAAGSNTRTFISVDGSRQPKVCEGLVGDFVYRPPGI